MKSRVFIGSSTEGLPIAYALQSNLEGTAEITVWEQNVFQPSEYILESLLKQLKSTDFGIFVFSADDLVQIRGQKQAAVRDNVIFEFGLFVGHLGRHCSVMLLPKGEQPRIPSDLWGVNILTFDPNRRDGNLEAAVGPASNTIRKLLAAVPSSKAEVPRELELAISERLNLLSDRQRGILRYIEAGERSTEDLARRFSQYSASELHYRLEHLRSLMFITVRTNRKKTDPRKARYALGDSYQKTYNSMMENRYSPSPPPPPPAPPRP